MSETIYVLNGPNLNMLGIREPEIYGDESLDDIAASLEGKAKSLDFELEIRQSNHEGHLIDWLHEAQNENAKAIILNAGALTHTSLGLYDAIRSIRTPVIEVHLSNPHARESYRHKSFVGMAAHGSIAGFGSFGYELALDAAKQL
ncbi:type II 3-dehydroquinate dehydratase [Altericroceibacterium endophyticum]|uniref:3-dehydroquinate dehydratase n=1 Tax=Altericroceibacterium endophyticum TaxID=1808508 RepID=A0A6I4T2E2_9SPHN|nr:type II 3-dehydroquinate dehydratase [Altericroceibacterium endophyticum]MXO64299.1 type II 3-dehydroquinate dehydratase [Altericroceibacterium endophyticum]